MYKNTFSTANCAQIYFYSTTIYALESTKMTKTAQLLTTEQNKSYFNFNLQSLIKNIYCTATTVEGYY